MLYKKILNIVIISFFLKLVVSLLLPVVGDEAYYWLWGQHLQLSYFDHPGMVAWLSALGDFLPFSPKWAAARFVFVVLSTVTFFVWIQVFLLRRKYSANILSEFYIFAAFYMLNPFLGLGSILITPDAPLLLFWGLASYFVLKVIETSKPKHYIWLGISLGLGFCSKYHIVLFPIVTIIALYLEKNLKVLFNKKTALTILFGLIFSLPVLVWNYQNDFSSFKFQLNHGLNAKQSYKLWWTTTYLLGQILIFNPVLLFSFFYKFKKTFFNVSAAGQWLFFLYSSFKAKVEANWPMTSHAAGLIEHDPSQKKIVRYSLIYYVVLWLGLPVYLTTAVGQKKLAELPTSLTIQDISQDLRKYQPLYGPTYQISSLLSLLGETPVYKLHGLSRYDFFDSMPQSHPTEPIFYVLKYSTSHWPFYYENFNKKRVAEFPKYGLEIFEFKRHE